MGPELQLFWLLLPAAAISGWLAAKRANVGRADAARAYVAQNYLQGIDFLLSEQPDKAIDAFARLLQADGGAVETHFALANLFRRRGEVERAIRIHHQLMEQTSLGRDQRDLAALELGMDYMRCGLLDRAEALFKQLASVDSFRERALTHLIEIYEQEQDWERAIASATELQNRCGKVTNTLTAQYMCERAEQLLAQKDFKAAEELLRQTAKADPSCVRVSLIEGRLAQQRGNYDRALSAYLNVEMQDAEFVVAVLPMMRECYQALGRMDEFQHYLVTISRRNSGDVAGLMLSELIAASDGTQVAVDFLSDLLCKHPSITGLDQLLGYLQALNDPSLDRHLMRLRDVTSSMVRAKSAYLCKSCGFESNSLYWQCPSCKHWASIKPLQVLERIH
jgi:lipopolysaccharide biosynthesis regulator YciM